MRPRVFKSAQLMYRDSLPFSLTFDLTWNPFVYCVGHSKAFFRGTNRYSITVLKSIISNINNTSRNNNYIQLLTVSKPQRSDPSSLRDLRGVQRGMRRRRLFTAFFESARLRRNAQGEGYKNVYNFFATPYLNRPALIIHVLPYYIMGEEIKFELTNYKV